MFFYHLLWTFIGGPLLFGCRFFGNLRLAERTAIAIPTTRINPGGIWVHALSVGEVKSAIPLVQRIKEDYPGKPLIFSSTTKQGLDLARKEVGRIVDTVITMPLDFWWSYRRVVRLVQPEAFLLVETDVWPGILSDLKSIGARALVINGRVSDHSYKLYKRVPKVAQWLFKNFKLCLMQTEEDRRRLLSIGLPPQKVIAVGNVKFDRPSPPMGDEEREQWRKILGLKEDDIILVAGSTHGQESFSILEVFFELQSRYPYLVLVLAPRKIEQGPELQEAVKSQGKTCHLRSKGGGVGRRPDVVILDSIGELERVYGVGHISFVGGSLVPFGGHNLLEPANFGIPVLYGPHTQNFAWMSDTLELSGGGIRVRDSADLKRSIQRLLEDEELRTGMGRAALAFVKQNQGALDRAMSHIRACIKRGAGC
ncbi:MAG: hypothetical protein DRH12_00435 [Deltaproteobacteria bacterium]|nr:MAG: hypothetical protein DRH12_00435 [Deltaproteobacteria bacterium]